MRDADRQQPHGLREVFLFPAVLFASDLIADVKTAAESHVKPSTSLISASEIDQCSLA
ncbi:protein of unknown function [Methanoculleus bourgensis]|uniref:Uncharacterized protein n=1 Tax=Methanoculleus bourgensis TaxID=83986 RepID=A0A0X3BKA0_9EURY|nr:protein of unknown function [Methanoculleus bourgensis]